MPICFDPFVTPLLSLKNRLVLAPMTTYSSHENGVIRDTELTYLERRAKAGFGMTMTAACYVHKTGHAFPGQWAASDDSFLPSLKSVADGIHRGSSFAVLQIHHGGRACSARLCGEVLSASDIPIERPNAETPRAMTEDEIQTMIRAFADAARRGRDAGFDGIEIHGANTYLLQQFVSPHSNRRNDVWGQDRLKFSREVVAAVLEAVGPGYPVGYRFSPEEKETPGIRLPDTLGLIDMLCQFPLAWLHISLSDFRQTSLVGDYTEPTLELVARAIAGRLPLIGVGSIKTREDADACLELGADLVAVGRAAIIEPDWPTAIREGHPRRQKFPKENAERDLVLPAGLVNRVLNAPGWFEVEEEAVATP